MNERDSEAVASQLMARGYVLVKDEAAADVILLNTCSVRDAAEQKALGKMQNLAASARRRRPQLVLGFLGCMAQARGAELLERVPRLDLVLGTQKIHRTADYLDRLLTGRRDRLCDIESEPGSEAEIRHHLGREHDGESAATAFVSIMQGCNQHCTFCIVPTTRGPERSRSIAEIVAECRELTACGVKEITLLGQIVTSYGRREIGERNGRSAFVQLLEAVHAVEGLARLRFTAPHPKGFGDDLVEAFARLPRLCEHAHLPAQSGSNRLLQRMHRGYTVERFLTVVDKLRQAQPRLSLTTDLIVGFPGETEADFDDTLSLVRTVEFDNAYLFKYSPRQSTPAATMPDQVPQEVAEARHARLLKLVNEIGARRYQTRVGTQVEVLVEGPSRRNAARGEGRTRDNRIVVFDGHPGWRGQLVDVAIERIGSFTLYGTVVSEPKSGGDALTGVRLGSAAAPTQRHPTGSRESNRALTSTPVSVSISESENP
jgi:tRNA-2-methylthio-N6-dimethylallyladenosine synthase